MRSRIGGIVALDALAINVKCRRTLPAHYSAFGMQRLNSTDSYSWPLLAAIVAAGCLAALLVAIPDIFLPDPSLGWVDAWYYVSLADRLPENLREYSVFYQSERIAGTLPGYLVSLAAPPLAANYISKSLFFVTTVFFLFASLRQTCGLRTAIFVSTMAGLYAFTSTARQMRISSLLST